MTLEMMGMVLKMLVIHNLYLLGLTVALASSQTGLAKRENRYSHRQSMAQYWYYSNLLDI